METKKEIRFTEVCRLDMCLPDYFSGYSYPVVSIPVNNGMTRKEIAEEIESEINANWDYFVNENGFTEEEMKIFFKFVKDLEKNNPNEIVISGIETDETADTEENDFLFNDPVYLYLSLCKPVNKYGINFLNE